MAYHFITGPTVITFSLWHTNRSINIDNHISLKTTGDFAIIIIICIFNMEATSLSHLYITAYIFYCLISFLIFSLARALSLSDRSQFILRLPPHPHILYFCFFCTSKVYCIHTNIHYYNTNRSPAFRSPISAMCEIFFFFTICLIINA